MERAELGVRLGPIGVEAKRREVLVGRLRKIRQREQVVVHLEHER